MKNFLLIALFFFFTLPVVGQTDSVEVKKITYRNQLDLDVEFLALSASYKRRVTKKISIGLNVGGGLALHFVYASEGFDESNFANEIVHIGIPLNYYLNNKIQFEIEPRYSFFFQAYDGDDAGTTYGIGLGAYYGEVVQIGIRGTIGYFKEGYDAHLLVSSSLLIIRIPIRW